MPAFCNSKNEIRQKKLENEGKAKKSELGGK